MKHILQTASRGAMIAILAATPVVAYAQAEEPAADAEIVEQTDDGAAVETMDAESGADVAADETMAPTEEATDTDVAQDGMDPAADPMAPEADTDMAADDGMMTEEGEQMAAEEPAKPVDGQITMQDANTVLAEDLLGATVYNGSDENVGDINDLIIGLDGSVKGVVIGVGGFLGMGEKDVAVEMAALDVVDMEGSTRIVTSATKTDLEAAQGFVSAADQASAQQQVDMESSGGTMGGTIQPTE